MPPVPVAPFATRATPWMVAVAVVSLLASLALLLRPGDVSRGVSVAADGYSRSALGHLGLLQLLRDSGERVIQSRRERSLAGHGLLVFAEPGKPEPIDELRLAALIHAKADALLVLPKRNGERDELRQEWVERTGLLPESVPDDIGSTFVEWAGGQWPGLLRSPSVGTWRRPRRWPEPAAASPWQLMRDNGRLEPVIACPEGVLLARFGSLFVLSDPDLIANHGLLRGDNAELALAMFRELNGSGAIVFDETLHGHRVAPSVWHAAGEYPLVLLTAHVLLLLALLAWTARGRFGPVAPSVAAIGAGKAFLLDNIAALLRAVGAAGPSLRRYGQQRVRLVAEALHAPRGLGDSKCLEFVLARMNADAGAELQRLLRIDSRGMKAGPAVATARRIRQLTEGLLHARSVDR